MRSPSWHQEGSRAIFAQRSSLGDIRIYDLQRDSQKTPVFLLAGFAPSLVLFRLPLIEKLVGNGHRVCVGANLSEFRSKDVARLEKLGVEIFDVKIARTSINPIAILKMFSSMCSALRQAKCETLICYTAAPVIFGTLAARAMRYCYVYPMVTGLGSMFIGEPRSKRERLTRSIIQKLYAYAFRLSDRVYFQNPDDPKDLIALNVLSADQPIEIIHGSGVDLEQFSFSPLQLSQCQPIKFLMVGRLLVDKGVREYAEAAKNVRSRFPDCQFSLVGPLDSNPTSITKAELSSWTWLEHRDWMDDVRGALRACHVYVLPSYREGTPRSVLEALAIGRAVITTDVPGCRETVVDGDNGLLVPPRDVPALVAAMERLISDPKSTSEMGTKGRRLAEKKYDSRVVYNALVARIGEL